MKLPADSVERFRKVFADRAVCVTGGAGFIGGHLVDALVSIGAQVTVIDDLSNSTADHLCEMIDLAPDSVRFVRGSILDDRALSQAIGTETELVFHLAAVGSVPLSIEQPERTWNVNATGTLRVLEASRRVGVERLVFSASSSAYGDAEGLPKREDMPACPTSPYGASKAAAEALVSAWASSYSMNTINLRYFNVFGPRQPADSAYAGVVAAFAKALLSGQRPTIYGDGSQTRDFTFVANAVLANLLAASCASPPVGATINIGTGRRVSIADLASIMAKAAGESQLVPEFKPARHGDILHSQADISCARSQIGYEPFVTLEEGVAETIEWFRGVFAGGGQAR